MLKDIIGPKGLVFLCIRNAPKDHLGYTEMSFQDIADQIGNLHLDRVKRTLSKLLKAGFIERISKGAPFKNRWRVALNVHGLMDNLTNQNKYIKGSKI